MAWLDEDFDAAVAAVSAMTKDPGVETKLRLYALYKQATEGDVSGARPGFTNPIGRAKFDAWAAVSGTPRDEAMTQYVDTVETLRS
ncbi:acyl-CoA-binding protein [Phycicoccus sp. CSK15P-2]|uniref:acyl-CoA-binding protein n=1 Tax=Phycicoccus sp. CSK15P-2 TaxID=2807627 RepID=UPI001951F17C|nr:acyl-CoA-binding protein [Phycicoccus sp. CSK15P-2]MBM6403594.1 acyl-CoA-binding protein [Phycicoccus sp. CSK15P-2]MBM6405059.1 acyl-CoA-binding protein [Phycicoccus sp. CSK15P-2]